MSEGAADSRRSHWLLIAGLLAGVALAAFGLLARPKPALPQGAVARVNDHLILRDNWLRAVAAVAAERRAPLTDDDRRHILERLVDEELLVQHGVALGLVEQDARLRSTMVSEVMLAATSGANAASFDEAALRRFYDEHRDLFAPADRLRVKAWRLDAEEKFLPYEPAVPDALLPPAKLEAYLGPDLVAQALALQAGQLTAPSASNGGRVVVQLLEKKLGAPPPFEQVRDEVRNEARRQADEATVRELLQRLRSENRVTVSPELP